VPHLRIIINHQDVRVRREAVRSMAKLRDEAAARVLLSAVDDADPEVRLLALRSLGTSGARVAVPRLREIVRLPNRTGKNTELIRAAAIALGRIGADEAIGDIEKAAKRPLLFGRRRLAACEAARWAAATLRGVSTGEAPEGSTRRASDGRDEAPRDPGS
jgi:HEAT repeat protein